MISETANNSDPYSYKEDMNNDNSAEILFDGCGGK
jgi:hypothetical protein